jgi:L-rhamnose mutarotase
MLQKGFLMYLNKGAEQEYEKRHNELWPELESTLKAYGISNYSIFLEEETNILFASYQCPTDFDENVLAKEKIVKKWWTFMSDIMSTNLDLSPKSKSLKQVFHLK